MRLIWFAAVAAIAGLSGLATPARAQYPTQYPPGQYPPNTYPPNTYPQTYPPGTYPPNTYPPNTVPVRLPGGVPVGVPVPDAKIPGRKEKSAEDAKITIVSADGALRRLREKDLVLGVKKGLLRFRLLPKTQFLDAKNAPVRDSLIHPGDQLQVQVSPDDVETALRIVLIHSGSSSDRSAAERPFDPESVREPRTDDFTKPRTISTHSATQSGEPATDPAPEEKSDSAAPGAPPAPAASTAPAGPDMRPQTDAAILADTRAESARFTSGLPNYLAQQVTTRYFATGFPARWQAIDEVTAELAYVGGKEQYRDFRIDGQPIDRPEKRGAWSTGEFSTTLEDVLSTGTNASFHRRGEEKLGGRAAWVFDYSVTQANSHWTMVAPDGRQYSPAYEGSVWIDRETRRVLRIEQRADSFPRDLWLKRAESSVEYTFVKVDQKTYLLPAKGESVGCMSGSGTCTRNAIEFRNYRKFTTDSSIDFGK